MEPTTKQRASNILLLVSRYSTIWAISHLTEEGYNFNLNNPKDGISDAMVLLAFESIAESSFETDEERLQYAVNVASMAKLNNPRLIDLSDPLFFEIAPAFVNTQRRNGLVRSLTKSQCESQREQAIVRCNQEALLVIAQNTFPFGPPYVLPGDWHENCLKRELEKVGCKSKSGNFWDNLGDILGGIGDVLDSLPGKGGNGTGQPPVIITNPNPSTSSKNGISMPLAIGLGVVVLLLFGFVFFKNNK